METHNLNESQGVTYMLNEGSQFQSVTYSSVPVIWNMVWSSNSTPGCIPRKIQILIQKVTCTPMFRAAPFTIARTWNNPCAHQKTIGLGLPWWHSGWESACQCKRHGFEPWSGNIPHAAAQLGPWATTTEPARLEPVLRNKRGRNSERPAHRNEEWPPLAATRESPSTETKTQHSQK